MLLHVLAHMRRLVGLHSSQPNITTANQVNVITAESGADREACAVLRLETAVFTPHVLLTKEKQQTVGGFLAGYFPLT